MQNSPSYTRSPRSSGWQGASWPSQKSPLRSFPPRLGSWARGFDSGSGYEWGRRIRDGRVQAQLWGGRICSVAVAVLVLMWIWCLTRLWVFQRRCVNKAKPLAASASESKSLRILAQRTSNTRCVLSTLERMKTKNGQGQTRPSR